MKAGVFYGPRDIRVETRNDPIIHAPTDIVVKVTYACICGSDLWTWRGQNKRKPGTPAGHEFMGIVEKVGNGVHSTRVGDLVIVPFSVSDGVCPECRVGMTSVCRNKQNWGRDGNDGGQSEKVRVPFAEGTVTVVPGKDIRGSLMPALLPLTDVLCTGHHAAVSAGVDKTKTVAVIGDGAVGLCAVAAAKRLGAKQIFLVSTHDDRAKIGQQFGATKIINARGEQAVAQIKALTNDTGVDCTLECVGTDDSWQTSFGVTRAGGMIGYVGVPHAEDLPLMDMFHNNIGVAGGVAPAAAYIPELLPDVLAGRLDVSDIFTLTITLDDLAEGYTAMEERRAIKTLIKF